MDLERATSGNSLTEETQESVAHLLTRPVGRPPNHVLRFYASFSFENQQSLFGRCRNLEPNNSA